MIVYTAGLIAMGIAGFFIGGTWTAVALSISWSALATAFWRSRIRKRQAQTQSEQMPPPMLYGAIDEIFEALGAIARERGWDIDKRLEIARLACERSELTLDDLEKLYDQGGRSLLGNAQHRTD